jgi:CheY-like chemotaxis protein
VSTDTEKTILIVDNQPREIAALRNQLEFAGFKTQVAHTGTGAINKIRPWMVFKQSQVRLSADYEGRRRHGTQDTLAPMTRGIRSTEFCVPISHSFPSFVQNGISSQRIV